MNPRWLGRFLDKLHVAVALARKDAKAYFFKAPNLTYGIFIPVFMFLAVTVNRPLEPAALVAGLASLSVLFSTTSIEAVSVVIEKEKGTMMRLAAAPVSFLDIVLGKTLAGTAFGAMVTAPVLVVSLIYVPAWATLPWILAVVVAGSFMFSGMGVLISAFARWTPEAQMLCNLVRFPMPFLAGVFLPIEHLGDLQPVSALMPLTRVMDGLLAGFSGVVPAIDALVIAAIITVFSTAFLLSSSVVLRRATVGS